MIFTPNFLSHIHKSGFAEQIRKGVLTIDNSEYCTWNSCFTMGLYSGGLRRVGAKSRAPLAFGGAVHAGLDAYLKAWSLKKDVHPDDPAEGWRALALADAAVTKLDSLGDARRNTRVLLSLLESYILQYSRMPSIQFNIFKIDNKPAVEQSFSIPLGEVEITFEGRTYALTIMWSGKIDVLSNYERAIAPVDHKTTTVMGEKFVDDKERSSQMLGYTFAARYLAKLLFDNMPVFGVRINALAMRQTGFEFKMFDIPYPEWKIAEWQRETIQSIRDLVSALDKFLGSGQSVPNREHCVTKYGKCAYFDVCDTPPTMRDRMIFDDSYYFISEWSPLNE